jgi:hypothetical protein
MSGAYTTTVWIERIIEVEVIVRVVPDTSATYWEPGCAGEAGIESFKVEHSDAESLTDEERARAIEKATDEGPPEPAPDDDPPDNNYNHPF